MLQGKALWAEKKAGSAEKRHGHRSSYCGLAAQGLGLHYNTEIGAAHGSPSDGEGIANLQDDSGYRLTTKARLKKNQPARFGSKRRMGISED